MVKFLNMRRMRTDQARVPEKRQRRTAFVTVLLLIGLTGPLFSDSTLSERSPFLPPGYGKEEVKPVEPVVQPQGPISRELEFRGIVQIDGVYQFSVYNKKEQKGYWLKENEREDGIAINDFDENASTIVIMMNGRSERLSLMAASEQPLPVSQVGSPSSNKSRASVLPPELRNKNQGSTSRRKVVPRRRVILPKKN